MDYTDFFHIFYVISHTLKNTKDLAELRKQCWELFTSAWSLSLVVQRQLFLKAEIHFLHTKMCSSHVQLVALHTVHTVSMVTLVTMQI